VILGWVGFEICLNAIRTIPQAHHPPIFRLTVIGPALSILLKEWIYQRTVRIGRRLRSKAVVANAWHHRSDALSSVPALIAVAVSAIYPQFAYADHIGAVIVSVFIFKVAWKIIHGAFSELTDKGMKQEIVARIATLSQSIEGVRSVHKIRSRPLGEAWLIDMHVLVDGDMSVTRGHQITGLVKDRLRASNLDIIDVLIHLEPDSPSDGCDCQSSRR